MKELLERLRALLQQRTERELWGIVVLSCMAALVLVHQGWAAPLQSRAKGLDQEIEQLKEQMQLAERVVRNVRDLQSELVAVEKAINKEEKIPLLSLLEELAKAAGLTESQLESITPRPSSPNERYPETRVEVRLKGATLPQTIAFLFKIEVAQLHLIVRSLRIQTRGKQDQVLDVSFSVSSFERA